MATCNPADALGWQERLGRPQAGPARRRARHHRPRRRPLPQPDHVARTRRPVRRHQRLPLLRHLQPHARRQGRPRRTDHGRQPPPPHRADLPGHQRRRHGLERRPSPTSPRPRPTRSPATSKIEKLHEVGKPPPWLQTDKPWDNPEVTGEPVPVTVRIPPLDPLTHNPPTSTRSTAAPSTANCSTDCATTTAEAERQSACSVGPADPSSRSRRVGVRPLLACLPRTVPGNQLGGRHASDGRRDGST